MTMEKDCYDQTSCLSWDSMCSYAFEQLGAGERQTIESHLSTCVLCKSATEAVLQLLKERSFTRQGLEQWFDEQGLLSPAPWAGGKQKDLSD
jgi:hypothetical protein